MSARTKFKNVHRRRRAWKIRKRCQGSGSRAKYVAAKRVTRTDLKLAVLGRSFQQSLKYRDLSRNGESHLFLAQLIIQFICCHCLVLIHVIVVQEREPSKANSVSARFASVSIWLALTLAYDLGLVPVPVCA